MSNPRITYVFSSVFFKHSPFLPRFEASHIIVFAASFDILIRVERAFKSGFWLTLLIVMCFSRYVNNFLILCLFTKIPFLYAKTIGAYLMKEESRAFLGTRNNLCAVSSRLPTATESRVKNLPIRPNSIPEDQGPICVLVTVHHRMHQALSKLWILARHSINGMCALDFSAPVSVSRRNQAWISCLVVI